MFKKVHFLVVLVVFSSNAVRAENVEQPQGNKKASRQLLKLNKKEAKLLMLQEKSLEQKEEVEKRWDTLSNGWKGEGPIPVNKLEAMKQLYLVCWNNKGQDEFLISKESLAALKQAGMIDEKTDALMFGVCDVVLSRWQEVEKNLEGKSFRTE
jgi:hypothetical protein